MGAAAFSNGHIVPEAANELITAHGISAEKFWETHSRLSRPWKFRIVMPTNDLYIPVAAASIGLLNRYWPDHPPVDVICRGAGPLNELPAQPFHFGTRDNTTWCAAMISYLQDCNTDEVLMLMLDDYGLFKPVERHALALGQRVLLNDPDLASFALTWQPTQAMPYAKAHDVVLFDQWAYSVNTQAALWRRSSLLRVLQALPNATIEQFELSGSAYYSQNLYPRERHAGAAIPPPSNPSGWVDNTDKAKWVFAYHNLMRRGAIDPRHSEFLKVHGITLS